MRQITFSILLLTFSVFAQDKDDKNYSLQFNSDNLKNSTLVTVAGVEVPLKVVTEIQKVCAEKKLSVDECNSLTEKGCLEFERVYEDENIKVIDVPVIVEVDLHINEHTHVIHKEQKKYTYHYDVRVINTQSESHEYVELPPVHEVPTYSDQNVVIKDNPRLPAKSDKVVTVPKVTPPSKVTTPSAPVNNRSGFGMVRIPRHLRLTQDIVNFVYDNRLNCKVLTNGRMTTFAGPDAERLSSIIAKHFPNLQRFDRARNSQVVELFEDLKRKFL